MPIFEAPLNANSYQVDTAHQAHILELDRIIGCFIELLK